MRHPSTISLCALLGKSSALIPVRRGCAELIRRASTTRDADEVANGAAPEPDADALKALFESSRATPPPLDGVADDDDDDDDDGFASLLAPTAAAPVSAEERDAFMERLNLKELVDDEYERASDAVRAAAAAALEGQSAAG